MQSPFSSLQPNGWTTPVSESPWLKAPEDGSNTWTFIPPFPCPDLVTAMREQTPDIELDYKFNVAPLIPGGECDTCNPRIRNIIAISSAKGGVGKSSVTANLAMALAAMGAKVGILDADIHGPSIPLLLGQEHAEIQSLDGKNMEPIFGHGVQLNSMGFLADADNANIWRGPMASRALEQLFEQTNWPEVDYLFIDMPPGTGDIQLTLTQKLPVTAALIVTTSQALALRDTQRGITMCNRVSLPVVGMVENMSYLRCDDCGKQHPLFGENGAAKLADKCGIELIGQLPFDPAVSQINEQGKNLQDTDLDGANDYRKLAQALVARLYFTSKPRGETIAMQPA